MQMKVTQKIIEQTCDALQTFGLRLPAPVARPHRRVEVEELEELVATALAASLLCDEGRPARCSFAVVDADEPMHTGQIRFTEPCEFSAENLAKLAPATAPSTTHILVSGATGPRKIWGIAGAVPCLGPVVCVDVLGAGVARVRCGPFTVSRFAPGARGDVVLQKGKQISVMRNLLQSSLERPEYADTLVAIVREIRSLGHGGAVLLLPTEDSSASALDVKYRCNPCVSTLHDLLETVRVSRASAENMQKQAAEAEGKSPSRANAIREAAGAEWGFSEDADMRLGPEASRVARLTAVDGALVLSASLNVVGFGAKITATVSPTARVLAIRILPPNTVEEVPLEAVGGTRHRSAVAFAATDPTACAIVVSQDGKACLVRWCQKQDAVLVTRDLELLL